MADAGQASGGETLGDISTALVRLMKEAGGKGPTKTKSHWAGDDALLVLMGGGYTAAEETIYRGGRGMNVRDSRHAFHDVIEQRMRDVVTDTTGREVVAFISASHQDPDLTVLIFVLDPTEKDSPLSAPDQSSPR
jgi:uncharacterized protein YbcI